MKKSSLRTVKEKNRRLILRALLTEGGLSRIELAKQTGLSPSTITALVGELLAEGVVQESGLRAATAGRSRAGLTICPDYGRVVVVDIGRSHAVLYLYDMALQCVFHTVLPDHGGDGNELLTSISDAIFQGFSMEELHAGKMKSINLSDSVTTMYPMLNDNFEEIASAVKINGSTQNITYSADSKYTSSMILSGIKNALDKAVVTDSK